MLSIKQMENDYQQMRQYKKQIVKSTKPPMENIVHHLKANSKKLTAQAKLPPIGSKVRTTTGTKKRPTVIREANSAQLSNSMRERVDPRIPEGDGDSRVMHSSPEKSSQQDSIRFKHFPSTDKKPKRYQMGMS